MGSKRPTELKHRVTASLAYGESARDADGRGEGGGEPRALAGDEPRPGVAAAPGADDELRCGCGSLMARRRGDTVELKCRRCRRRLYLQLLPDGGVTLTEPES
jgi:hypothetical protein